MPVPAVVARASVSADTKQYLYLDPGRLLGRAPYLWDPHVGAGTVPHQQIGYLFPMGPYFWLIDQVGVPDWVAQRLWLGTISLAAVLGARWLFRDARRAPARARIAGALVYMLTPYQLAFTRADLGAAARVGRAAVARRAHDARGAPRRVARPGRCSRWSS